MRVNRLLAVVLSLGGCAFAAPVGTLGIGSSGVVNATLTSILFTPDPSAIGACPGAACNGDVNTGTNLVFSGGPLAIKEGILINKGMPFGSPPPAGAQYNNPFLQFAAHANLTFTFAGVDAGSANTDCFNLANGDSCSIMENGTVSPVVLTRSGVGSNVSISLYGTTSDGSGTSSWTGQFAATIPSMTPYQIAQYFCGTDAFCTAAEIAASPTLDVVSTSGSFIATTVPEPNTTVLLGAGLVLLALTLRRFKAA